MASLLSATVLGRVPASERAILPSLDHLNLSDFENVYEPAEDTFLLCDALHQERDELCSLQPCHCVEIGCGSGCVITYLGQLLQSMGQNKFLLLGTDINPHALRVTQQTAMANKVSVDVIRTHLLSGLETRARGQVDVLLFNPPYVPTPDEEVSGCGIEASWAGGEDGRKVIDAFLPKIKTFLSVKGRLYMILVKENKPAEIAEFCELHGLNAEVIITRRARNEALMVMKITKAA